MLQQLSPLQNKVCNEILESLPQLLAAHTLTKKLTAGMEEADFQRLNTTCKNYVSRLYGPPVLTDSKRWERDAQAIADSYMMGFCATEELSQLKTIQAGDAYSALSKMINGRAVEAILKVWKD